MRRRTARLHWRRARVQYRKYVRSLWKVHSAQDTNLKADETIAGGSRGQWKRGVQWTTGKRIYEYLLIIAHESIDLCSVLHSIVQCTITLRQKEWPEKPPAAHRIFHITNLITIR